MPRDDDSVTDILNAARIIVRKDTRRHCDEAHGYRGGYEAAIYGIP